MLPYAMRLYLAFSQSILGSAAYAAELGTGFALLAVLEARGLRAHGPQLPARIRRAVRRTVARHVLVAAVLLASLGLMIPFGLNARLVWLVAPLGGLVLRILDRAQSGRGTRSALAES